MRISNIRHFLGGADQVIAREVLQGNQFLLNISGDENLDYSTATFTLATELFTADVTDGRSSITINSLTKDANANVQSYTSADLIRNTTQGSFDLKVPSTLLSDFDHGGHVHTASPDTASPYIVAMKLQWTNGEEIKSIRFLFVIRYQPQ
jgi:hypothetical protein|tara:strand:- start:1852 stop:2301 length:450 start_codon:yes stop_codon:yes gene_type:complete